MMEEVILYDHSPVGKHGALCRQIQRQIDSGACRLVDLLDEEERTRPIIFQQDAEGWKTQQYVGLFQCQDQRVVIGSRFDRDREPFFLWRLMESFLEDSLLALEDVGSRCGDDFFDALLAAKLAVQLQRAWKKGPLRAYRTFERNSSRIRGQLDVPRHIRENLGLDNGRAACRTREYSLDNRWNILFLQAAGAVRRRHPGLLRRLEQRLPEFRAALRTLEQAAPHWFQPRQAQVLEHTRRTLANPVFRAYEPARKTARAILRRLGAAPFGPQEDDWTITGVFFNLDALWETFLYQELFGAPEGVRQQERTVWGGRLTLRPDLLWQERGVVLDAKNRPAWGRPLKQPLWTHVIDDVFQVFGYMELLHCPDGGVIFPVSRRAEISLDPTPSGGRFWRIPVLIPDAGDYPRFRAELEQELCRLRGTDLIRRVASPAAGSESIK